MSGTRVFVDLRGHGASSVSTEPLSNQWTYQTMAADIAATAEHVAATRAVGVSAGASTLLTLATTEPGRFERLGLVLPVDVDKPHVAVRLAATDAIADAIETNDQTTLAKLLVNLQPETARKRLDTTMWARRQAAQLGGTNAAAAFRGLPRDTAIPDPALLRVVTADVLLLAQRGDEAHPVKAAERLAELLPKARLRVSQEPWIWSRRPELRTLLTEFLRQ